MAASALTTATASALQSTIHELPKSSQQSPRHTQSTSVAVNSAPMEVSKALQEGEKFIKWDEVSFSEKNEFILCLFSVSFRKHIFFLTILISFSS